MASYTYEFIELGDDIRPRCTCCRFNSGTDLPTPRKLSLQEIKEHQRRFSTGIISDWSRLNAVIKRFEPTIRKRWLKKNSKQRREILLRAWPEMAAGHRPDFAGFRKAFKAMPQSSSRTRPSAAYLWPYINLEDLQQNNPLLLFLHSRGRNFPDKFIAMDIEAAHLGKGWQFTVEDDEESMLFLEQRTPRTFGRILDLVEAMTPPVNGMGLRQTYHPGLGLLGLEIQAGIYSFLLSAATLILHDFDRSHFVLADHQPVHQSLPSQCGEYLTLQDHALEAPYCLPQKFDLERLKTLVAARRAAAEDHVWMLREDPAYFIEAVKEWKEHDHTFLQHECISCWRGVAAKTISDAVEYLLIWDHIDRQLRSMPSLESQLKNAHQRLPKHIEAKWAEIEGVVALLISVCQGKIKAGFPVSPRLRHGYMWDIPDATFKDIWRHKGKRSDAERRVDLIFFALTDPDLCSLHSLNHLVQEAQFMLDTDAACSELIDPWLLTQFADLALLSELRLRIQSYEPWSSAWKACGVPESAAVIDRIEKLYTFDESINVALSLACAYTDSLGDPNSVVWRYPAEKRATKEVVNQLRHAEAHLDMFWTDIDDNIYDNTGRSLMSRLYKCGLAKRKLYRTPKWKEPLILPPVNKPASASVLQERDANILPILGNEASKTHTPKPKNKVKTRGIPITDSSLATPAAAATPEPQVAQDSTSSTDTISVPKRAYKVLNALLPHPSVENHHNAEVNWFDLLNAMNTIGLQPEKLYGSVWSFKPVPGGKVDLEKGALLGRSIHFHEPKEVRKGNKISSHMVRAFGRRLKHGFGWWDGMFVCE